MANLDAAIEGVLQLAERHRAIVDLADALKEIPSIDQAIKERRDALATITAKHDAAKDELATAEAELAALEAKRAEETETHRANMAAMLDQARTDSASILATARAAAADLVDRANLDAAHVEVSHAETMAPLLAELAAKRAELADATAALDTAKADHADVVRKTEALKQAAQSVLG